MLLKMFPYNRKLVFIFILEMLIFDPEMGPFYTYW